MTSEVVPFKKPAKKRSPKEKPHLCTWPVSDSHAPDARIPCKICGQIFIPLHWPAVLAKAVGDPFTYFVKLRNGQLIQFQSAHPADLRGEWVHLEFPVLTPPVAASGEFPYEHAFQRGLEIRLDEILLLWDSGS